MFLYVFIALDVINVIRLRGGARAEPCANYLMIFDEVSSTKSIVVNTPEEEHCFVRCLGPRSIRNRLQLNRQICASVGCRL
jgi:hypothetical protein